MQLLKTLLLITPFSLSVLALSAPEFPRDTLAIRQPEAEPEPEVEVELNSPIIEAREAEAETFLDDPMSGMSLNLARDLGIPDINKRACDNKSGCKCKKNYAGVWCAQCTKGGSYVVTVVGKKDKNFDHVYQCNKNGNCCDYGYATKCKNGKAGRCGS